MTVRNSEHARELQGYAAAPMRYGAVREFFRSQLGPCYNYSISTLGPPLKITQDEVVDRQTVLHIELEEQDLSSYLDRCIPTWLKWDMAPAILQGDAFGWGIYSYGINICVDILGIANQVPWSGKWRQRDEYDTSAFVVVGKELSQV